jgi:hypothetical protein
VGALLTHAEEIGDLYEADGHTLGHTQLVLHYSCSSR